MNIRNTTIKVKEHTLTITQENNEYYAICSNNIIHTQAKTIQELIINIHNAIECL